MSGPDGEPLPTDSPSPLASALVRPSASPHAGHAAALIEP
jgi:hypothetical protein